VSKLGDSWVAHPKGTVGPVPPRPDVAAPPSVPTPHAAAYRPAGLETFATAPGWQKVGAVLGVTWSFFFLLTIPGWLALGRYRKWKSGDIPTPRLLIGWGYAVAGLLVLAMLNAAVSPQA
jgi:hypothetical protein